MDKKNGAESLQTFELKKISSNTPFGSLGNLRTNKNLSLKDCKRLLSQLIKEFISGSITGQASKDLAYLLGVYVQLIKDVDVVKRIEALESKLRRNQ